MYIRIQVNYCLILMTDFCRKFSKKLSNYKNVHEFSTSGSRGVTLRRTYGQRDRH